MRDFTPEGALQKILVALLPIVLGMMCHEIAHGWVALKMGDPTARNAGRLSFNPLRHLDPTGSLCFLLTAVTSSATGIPFIFGWAKPVPIHPARFRKLRQGMILVSLAGATANLLLAFGFTLLLLLLINYGPALPPNSFWFTTCKYGLFINCTLAWFNLLPIPPLDGSKVLAALLPASLAGPYLRLGRYGFAIIILLLVTNVLGTILNTPISLTVELFVTILSKF